MPTPASAPLIAVMNSSRDLVTILQDAIEACGFRTVTLVSTIVGGESGPLAFLREHEPVAAVYSISPPYRESWEIFQKVRRQWSVRRFVVVTTNIVGLQAFVGPTEAIEIIGRTADLQAMTLALQNVLALPVSSFDASADGVGAVV